MKVIALLMRRRRLVYYSEPILNAPGEDRPSARAGWRVALDQRWRGLQDRLRAAEGATGTLLRGVEEFLKRFESRDEPMLRALRLAETLELVHPASMAGGLVKQRWRRYLQRQIGKHVLWLGVNAIVSPFAIIILTPLPGPNVLGYWFVYRGASHALALMGIKRGLSRVLPTTTRAESELDTPLQGDHEIDRALVERLEAKLGLGGLREFLKRGRRQEVTHEQDSDSGTDWDAEAEGESPQTHE